MKKNTYFLVKIVIAMMVLVNLTLMTNACKNDLSKNEGKSLEAIPIKEGGNAAMINNPITADASKIDSSQLAAIQFEESIYKFPKAIKEGEVVRHTYSFKNIGKAPLLIKDCISSCGCTVPNFSKEPIAPGKSGSIELKFDSKNKEGHIQKKVSVFANTLPNETFVGFEIDVNK